MSERNIRKVLNPALDISLSQLVDVLPDAAFICNEFGEIQLSSEEVLNFFNISSKAKIAGSNLKTYFSIDSIEEAFALLSLTINSNKGRQTGKFQVKKSFNEMRLAEVTFSPVLADDEPTKLVLVVFREYTGKETFYDESAKTGARLTRLFETIVNFAGHTDETTQHFVAQIGETLGAVSCALFQIEKEKLSPFFFWESPFNPDLSPFLCSTQLFDYYNDHADQVVLIRKPLLTTFLDSEAAVSSEQGIKALLGFPVLQGDRILGFITAIFTNNYSLNKSDEKFILTVSTLLGNHLNYDDQPQLLAEPPFRQVIDCFSDPVYVISHEGLIMEVNKSVTACYGYEREELIGQTQELLSAEGMNDLSEVEEVFSKAFEGDSQRFEWWGKRKNGEIFPKEVIFSRSKYYGHDVIMAIGRDLTESKKIEKELVRYNTELLESNSSKDKFFSILAHDLKNPFQGLLGFIDLLYEDIDELSSTQIKEYLSNVRNASYHTYALLENLLEWSRIQSGKMPFSPIVFDIKNEIESVINVLENNARSKNIKLINEVDEGIEVEADKNMIHSVIQNLITNAIKFSNTKGRVVVRSRRPKNTIKDNMAAKTGEKDWLEISVSDNGIGIPDEILPKLFKLNGQYSQAGTANEPGTGLGLVLCHEMVEKNGGRIWAESIAGQGTTFVFTVPLSN